MRAVPAHAALVRAHRPARTGGQRRQRTTPVQRLGPELAQPHHQASRDRHARQRHAALRGAGAVRRRRGRAPRAPAASPRGGAPSAGSPAGVPQAAQLEDRHLLAPGRRNADAVIRTRRAEMRTTKLGDLTVSAQGLGCMGMSEWYGAADWDESIATIHAALDAGVTFLDTADAYGAGHNEVLVGRAIARRRDEVQLATKFGIDRSGGDSARVIRGERGYVKRSCESSLLRLGVDVIALYYLHRPPQSAEIEETVGAMAELVAEGKVRYLGLSEVT